MAVNKAVNKFVPQLSKQSGVNFVRAPSPNNNLKEKIGRGENLIIFLGSSGTGRDTVLENCQASIKDSERIKRITTRSKRLNRLDRARLIFVNKKNFLNMLKAGEILLACHYRANNEFYGINRAELLKLKNQNRTYFFECTLLSLPLKKLLPKAKLIVLIPPSFDFLKKRLIDRDIKDWRKRFKNSCLEIKIILKNIKEMFKNGFVDLAFINFDSKETVLKIKKALKNKRYANQLQQEFFEKIKRYD